jgi:hypothetical protein
VKRWLIVAALAHLMSPTSHAAAEDGITAKDAAYKALYLLVTDPPPYYGQGYIERISTPRVYYDYEGKKKYYVFYSYIGPGEMPSWGDLEAYSRNRWARVFGGEEKSKYDVSRVCNFLIPATKEEPLFVIRRDGVPWVIMGRGLADRVIKKENPDIPYRYTRTIIEGPDAYFEYTFRGPLKTQWRYVLYNHIYMLSELAPLFHDSTERFIKDKRDTQFRGIFKSDWLEPPPSRGGLRELE